MEAPDLKLLMEIALNINGAYTPEQAAKAEQLLLKLLRVVYAERFE